VLLTATPDHHDGTGIRITQFRSWVADVKSVAGVERYVVLADLEEVLALAGLMTGKRCSLGPPRQAASPHCRIPKR
jgi:hypothetical protein